MLNKVKCKDCEAAEEETEGGSKFYICHRRSGVQQPVPLDHWCYEGVYRYGDKDDS